MFKNLERIIVNHEIELDNFVVDSQVLLGKCDSLQNLMDENVFVCLDKNGASTFLVFFLLYLRF